MAHQVKLLPMTQASSKIAGLSPAAPLLIKHPVNVPWKEEKDGPSAWAPPPTGKTIPHGCKF